jgi:hypothetical protein
MDHPAWHELPANVLMRVFQRLSLPGLCIAARVCTIWHAVAGSDSLWASILLHQYGRCSPLPTASNSSRNSLLQLRTCSLWGVGTLKAPLTASLPPDSTQQTHTLALSGTELSCLWSAKHARAAASGQPRSQPCTEAAAAAAVSAAADSTPSTPMIAIAAVASGSSHLVLLGCDGCVVDTRAASVKQQRQPAGVNQGNAATAMLLAWLLLQQHDGSGQSAAEGSNEQAATAVASQREGPRLSLHNPWLPPGGAVITSVASGVLGLCWRATYGNESNRWLAFVQQTSGPWALLDRQPWNIGCRDHCEFTLKWGPSIASSKVPVSALISEAPGAADVHAGLSNQHSPSVNTRTQPYAAPPLFVWCAVCR